MSAPTYIISKVADPIFAVFIGLSAATTRINREGKEKGRTTSETMAAGKRRLAGLAEQVFPTRSSNVQGLSSPEQAQMRLKATELQNERRKAAGLPQEQIRR
ncbi:unnamed protein product [Discula destructiva]